jgi:hypothetical protein
VREVEAAATAAAATAATAAAEAAAAKAAGSGESRPRCVAAPTPPHPQATWYARAQRRMRERQALASLFPREWAGGVWAGAQPGTHEWRSAARAQPLRSRLSTSTRGCELPLTSSGTAAARSKSRRWASACRSRAAHARWHSSLGRAPQAPSSRPAPTHAVPRNHRLSPSLPLPLA